MPHASLFETTDVIWRPDKKSEWTTAKVKDLVAEPDFLILSWNGRSFVQAETRLDSLSYAEKYVRIQLSTGVKVAVGLDQLLPLVGVSPVDPRVSSVTSTGLAMVKASSLKPGDRIMSADNDGITRSPTTLVGKANPGSCLVAKAKVRSCEPSAFYSLTIPVFQACVLGSGILVNTN